MAPNPSVCRRERQDVGEFALQGEHSIATDWSQRPVATGGVASGTACLPVRYKNSYDS
jgi:hypothetical protein